MLRLALVTLFLNMLVDNLFAQPSVVLVGQTDVVCSTGTEEKLLNACPNIATSNSNIENDELFDLPSTGRGFDIVHAARAKGDGRGEGYYIFGETRAPTIGPYLAFATEDEINNPNSWEIFTGRGLAGTTNWVGYQVWSKLNTEEGTWNPGDRARLFTSEKTCRNFRSEWNEALSRWLMLYGCSEAIWVRVAAKPAGPWSDATKLMDAQSGDIPHLLARCQALGPQLQGSRTTTIYWHQGDGSTNNNHIYSASLRQEGEQ